MALGAKLGSSLGGLAGMLYGGAKGSEAIAAKIADGLTGADKKYDQVEPEKERKKHNQYSQILQVQYLSKSWEQSNIY